MLKQWFFFNMLRQLLKHWNFYLLKQWRFCCNKEWINFHILVLVSATPLELQPTKQTNELIMSLVFSRIHVSKKMNSMVYCSTFSSPINQHSGLNSVCIFSIIGKLEISLDNFRIWFEIHIYNWTMLLMEKYGPISTAYISVV